MRDYIRFAIFRCRGPLGAATPHLTNESLYKSNHFGRLFRLLKSEQKEAKLFCQPP